MQIIIEQLSNKKSYLIFETASDSFFICSTIRSNSDSTSHKEVVSLHSLSTSQLIQVITKFLFPYVVCSTFGWAFHGDFALRFVFHSIFIFTG